jgi:hypothetical protein
MQRVMRSLSCWAMGLVLWFISTCNGKKSSLDDG